MRRRQATAILLSMILTASAFLPLSGIKAMAAEGSAEQDAVMIQTDTIEQSDDTAQPSSDSEELNSDDTSENSEEVTEETAAEEEEKVSEETPASDEASGQEENASEADEAEQNEAVAPDSRPEEETDSKEREDADVPSAVDSSEDDKQSDNEAEDQIPVDPASGDTQMLDTDQANRNRSADHLYAWMEGHEGDKYSTQQYVFIQAFDGDNKIGDTYPINILTDTAEGDDLTYTWCRDNADHTIYDHIEGETGPTYNACLSESGNHYGCFVRDNAGYEVSIFVTIYAAQEIEPGPSYEVERTYSEQSPMYYFTVPESTSYSFNIQSDETLLATLYDSEHNVIDSNYTDAGQLSTFNKRLNGGDVIYYQLDAGYKQYTATISFDKTAFVVYGDSVTDVNVRSGEKALLSVDAEGTNPITYQWYRGSISSETTPEAIAEAEITGETNSTLEANPDDSLWYSCLISSGSEQVWRYFSLKTYTLRAWLEGYDQNSISGYQNIDIDTGSESTVALHVNTDYAGESEISYQWYEVTGGHYVDPDQTEWVDDLEAIDGEDTADYTHNIVENGCNVRCRVSDGNEETWINVRFKFSGNLRIWADGHEDQKDNYVQTVDQNAIPGVQSSLKVCVETLDGEVPEFEWTDGNTGEVLSHNPYEYPFTLSDTEDGKYIFCHVQDKYNNDYWIYFSVIKWDSATNLSAWVEGEEEWCTSADYTVSPGESLLLKVHAETEVESELTYEWYNINGELMPDCTGASLQTPEIYEYHYYYCIVKDQYGNQCSIYFSMNIEYVENNLYAYPEGNDLYDCSVDLNVSPPGEVTLHTLVSADNLEGITYQWRKQNPETGEEVVIEGETSDTLTTDKIGTYQCQVTDSFYNTSTAWFFVTMENHLKVWPQGAEIDYDGEYLKTLDIVGVLGQDYTLVTEIEADYKDGLDIQWYKVTKNRYGEITSKENAGSGTNTINTGALNKSAFYICEVTDAYGNSATATFNIVLNHLKAFVFGTEEEEFSYIEMTGGQTQELRVGVSADDLNGIEYHWSSNEEYDPEQGTFVNKKYDETTDSLQVASKGYYTCEVTDSYNNIARVEFYVTINHLKAHGNGREYGGYYEHTVGQNSTLELKAFVEGDDLSKVTYHWEHTNYSEGIYHETISDATESSFTVINPSNQDEYRCYGSDGYGNEFDVWFRIYTNNFNLTIDGDTENTGSIHVETDENGDATLKVNVTADDMSGINIKWIASLALIELQNGTEDSYQIHLPFDLYGESEDAYMPSILCTASDQYGNSRTVSFDVTMPNKPFVEVYASLRDINGNDIPADFAGIFGTRVGEEFGFVAPRVEGYNFKGWYVHSEAAPYYTGDILCTTRNFKGTAEAEGNEYTAVYEPLGTAKVSINGGNSFYVNGIEKSTKITQDYVLGSSITVNVNASDFAYWENDAGAVLSRSPSYTFTVTSNVSINAVFNTVVQDQAILVFESAYSQVLARMQLASAQATDLLPTLPTRVGYTTIGWDMDGDGVYDADKDTWNAAIQRGLATENKVVTIYAVYKLKEVTYSITVTNGKGSGTYKPNDVVTAVANAPEAGKIFSHWIDVNNEEQILSYSKSYSFFADKDLVITAIYVDDTETVEAVGTTGIINMYQDTDNKKLTFVSMSTIPEGCTMDFAGVIATDDSGIGPDPERFTSENARFVRGMSWTGTACRYTWSKGKVHEGDTWYVRAYLVYTDANGNVHTLYGDPVWQTFNDEDE